MYGFFKNASVNTVGNGCSGTIAHVNTLEPEVLAEERPTSPEEHKPGLWNLRPMGFDSPWGEHLPSRFSFGRAKFHAGI